MPIFADSRAGHTYTTVTIGNQTWFAENLAYLPAVSPPDSGSNISDTTDTTPYYYVYGYSGTNVTEAKATSNYNTYGVLYNWSAAMTACPGGWHLPSDEEWTTLTDYLGGENIVGGKMKEFGTTHWKSPNTGATNSSKFNALPGGYRDSNGYVTFDELHEFVNWWTSTKYSEQNYNIFFRSLFYENDDVFRDIWEQDQGLSVRCVKD